MSEPSSVDDAMEMVSKIHEGHETKMKRYEDLVSSGVVTQSELDELRNMSIKKCRKEAEKLLKPFITGQVPEAGESLAELFAAAQSARDKQKIAELQNTVRDLKMEMVMIKTQLEHVLSKKVQKPVGSTSSMNLPSQSSAGIPAVSTQSYAPPPAAYMSTSSVPVAYPNYGQSQYNVSNFSNVSGAKRDFANMMANYSPMYNASGLPMNLGMPLPGPGYLPQSSYQNTALPGTNGNHLKGVIVPQSSRASLPGASRQGTTTAAAAPVAAPVVAAPVAASVTAHAVPTVPISSSSSQMPPSSSSVLVAPTQPAPASASVDPRKDPHLKMKQQVNILEVNGLSQSAYQIALQYIRNHVTKEGNQIQECGILHALVRVLFRPLSGATELALEIIHGILNVEDWHSKARMSLFLGSTASETFASTIKRLTEFLLNPKSEVKLVTLQILVLIARRDGTNKTHLRLVVRYNLTTICKAEQRNSQLYMLAAILWKELFPPSDPVPDAAMPPSKSPSAQKSIIDLSEDDPPPPPSSSSNAASKKPAAAAPAASSSPVRAAKVAAVAALTSPTAARSASPPPQKITSNAPSRSDSVNGGGSVTGTANSSPTSTTGKKAPNKPAATKTIKAEKNAASSSAKPTIIVTSKSAMEKMIKNPDFVYTLQSHARKIEHGKDTGNSYQFIFDLFDVDYPPMKEVDQSKILSILTKKCINEQLQNGELYSVLQSIILILLMAEGSEQRTLEVVGLGIIPRMICILMNYDYLGKPKEESDEIEDILFTAMRILNNIAKESDAFFDQVVAANPLPAIFRFLNHSQVSEYILYQASNLLMTLSTKHNFCSVSNFDTIEVLLHQPLGSQTSTLCNACEIVHNMLVLGRAANGNKPLKTSDVACLIKSDGILEHFVHFLTSSKTSQTLSINAAKALTTALSVMPNELKIDFAIKHKLMEVICAHLKPLSSLFKTQGCSAEAVKCLYIIMKDAQLEGNFSHFSKTACNRIKSYALECRSAEVQKVAIALAKLTDIDLEDAYESGVEE